MVKRKIIAVVGLSGSGKTETINYLMKKFQWPKVYLGEATFDEMKKRGLRINEKNERMIREELRNEYGKLYYAIQGVKKIEQMDKSKNVLVESLYSWNEYLFFKEKFRNNFITIAVYSSPQKRYKRLEKRKIRPLSFKEAQSRDYSQIENLSQAGPIAMGDFLIDNSGTKKELHKKIDKIISNI